MARDSVPLVTILVLNYCSLDDTLGCVASIRKIDYANYKLLVIDNNSPDSSGTELQKLVPPGEFMQLKKNYGYTGGNNRGIKRAIENGSDYILIINPDVRLPTTALQDYVEIVLKDSRIAALNSIQLQEDGKSIDNSFAARLLPELGYRKCDIDYSGFPTTIESKSLFGAALFISTEAIKKVGGFDPLYFAYGEESDLCARLRMHGYKLIITNKSPIKHLRTNYKKTLSDKILFLKLKGYYLSKLKNFEKSFAYEIIKMTREISLEIIFRKKQIYPFDAYKYDRKLVLSALLWLIIFSPIAYLHKKQEKTPGLHYI